ERAAAADSRRGPVPRAPARLQVRRQRRDDGDVGFGPGAPAGGDAPVDREQPVAAAGGAGPAVCRARRAEQQLQQRRGRPADGRSAVGSGQAGQRARGADADGSEPRGVPVDNQAVRRPGGAAGLCKVRAGARAGRGQQGAQREAGQAALRGADRGGPQVGAQAGRQRDHRAPDQHCGGGAVLPGHGALARRVRAAARRRQGVLVLPAGVQGAARRGQLPHGRVLRDGHGHAQGHDARPAVLPQGRRPVERARHVQAGRGSDQGIAGRGAGPARGRQLAQARRGQRNGRVPARAARAGAVPREQRHPGRHPGRDVRAPAVHQGRQAGLCGVAGAARPGVRVRHPRLPGRRAPLDRLVHARRGEDERGRRAGAVGVVPDRRRAVPAAERRRGVPVGAPRRGPQAGQGRVRGRILLRVRHR
ncbi:hypothetical protein IWQ57_006215, partial [Coemansia nantahalensis]